MSDSTSNSSGHFLMMVIATYNERDSLPELVGRIHQHMPETQILVVDDNSPDGTGQWVRAQMATDSRIELLHRESKEGLGAATIAGLRHALSNSDSAWIGTMDADLSHRPEDLVKLWRKTAVGESSADVIIGSRYIPGGKITNWSWRRRVASRAVNFFARWVLWLPSQDNSGAFRIYHRDALQRIDLDQINCSGFAYLEQILVHLKRSGSSFEEVPIVFAERVAGSSKVNPFELLSNLRDIVWLAVTRR